MRLSSIAACLFVATVIFAACDVTPEPTASTGAHMITDLPQSYECNELVACACDSGPCACACASTWCTGLEASTACKLCLVDAAAGCGESFDACTAPEEEPPQSCCGGLPACAPGTVASLCEEEEHVGDCGAADCMTCCTETASGCTYTAYCSP
jgi:hypothetical protein